MAYEALGASKFSSFFNISNLTNHVKIIDNSISQLQRTPQLRILSPNRAVLLGPLLMTGTELDLAMDMVELQSSAAQLSSVGQLSSAVD